MTTSYDVDAYVVELRARIRGLEAELADVRGDRRLADYYIGEDRKELVARAEKAEARVAELEAFVLHLGGGLSIPDYMALIREREASE